jgi:hypothetical protein
MITMDFINTYKDIEIKKNENSVDNSIDNSNNENVNNQTNDETNEETNNNTNIDIINNDERGGIIYDLMHILDDIYVYSRTFIENNYFNLSENDDFSLVYPNIYIGNYSTSTNKQLLTNLGITHIISVIPSFNPPFEEKFKYLHIEAYDDEIQDIKQYFEISNEFISKCLNEGGKILIHCMVGRSRSVTIFLAFLIHIIQGYFHKKNLNLEDCNDIYNSIEYNKFLKDKTLNNKFNNKFTNSYDGISNQSNHSITNDNYETITTKEHIKPQLNNKEKNFILYKKEKMLNEVDELISTYSMLKKEITLFKNDSHSIDGDSSDDSSHKNIDELNQIINQRKQNSGNHFIIQLLKYVKTYRIEANPNPYFITQLCEYIF